MDSILIKDTSFQGLSVAPEYQDRFDSLANEAIEYYDEPNVKVPGTFKSGGPCTFK